MSDCNTALNDAIRKIFTFQRWESVRSLREGFGYPALSEMFDKARRKFTLSLSNHGNKTISRLHAFVSVDFYQVLFFRQQSFFQRRNCAYSQHSNAMLWKQTSRKSWSTYCTSPSLHCRRCHAKNVYKHPPLQPIHSHARTHIHIQCSFLHSPTQNHHPSDMQTYGSTDG